MRLHVLSDLHFEFGPIDIPDTNADVVVLAGDVAVGPRGLDWIRYRFPDRPVVYVLGNHEFYHHNLPRLTELLKNEAQGSHIHLLENSSVKLAGFTFLGCTLWTNFVLRRNPERDMAKAERLINDYRIIHFGAEERVLSPQDTVRIHAESVAWLKSEFVRHDPARTIVVTHHAPSPRSEATGYANGPLSASFVSDLTSLVEQSGIPLWIHGHTHHNVDYQLGVTRVLTNQRGYPQEVCAGFNPEMVIEIEPSTPQWPSEVDT
jgi:predicted phosphodiesterase